MDCGPTRSGMAAAQKLLVLILMTGTAIAGGQVIANHETMVVDFLLARCSLVTIQTIYAFLRVD